MSTTELVKDLRERFRGYVLKHENEHRDDARLLKTEHDSEHRELQAQIIRLRLMVAVASGALFALEWILDHGGHLPL